MRIGFIGLGIMGKPMALNLIKGGHDLVVYDKFAGVDELTQAGASIADSGAAVAGQVDVVITMLPNSPHVVEAICGPGGVLEGAREGLIIVDMSSIAPATSQEVEQAAKAKGVALIDAPVSGGQPKAIDGSLAIMVGGDATAFETVKPLLELMGGSVTRVGDIGSGNVTKLANQMIVALNIAAVSEALTLATKAGVDPEAVFEAIRGGLAGSTVMDAKVPMILDRNFGPGFRIELHIKDLQNALDTAHANHVAIPLSAEVMETLQSLAAHGEGSLDHSAIVRHYERMSQVEVRRRS
ncbi:MAG: 2-hydroxy-3-oxopropionate reductase [Arachnia sp.]